MKKVLFATTALVALGSMAAADVRLSGYGRFGLDYNSANDDNYDNGNNPDYNGISSTNITSRLRLQVDMSTETDGGVGFNARVRMQAESRDNQNLSNGNSQLLVDGTGAPVLDANGDAIFLDNDDNGFNGARFGVTYGGLAVNVGNIIGAVENAPGLYTTGTRSAGTGIDGMGFNSLAIKSAGWDAYSSDGQGANGIEALYTVGGFTGHISYSNSNDVGIDPVAGVNIPGEERTGIMLTYSFGDYYVTGAYQDSNNGPMTDAGDDINDLYFLAAGGQWGAFGARIAYGANDVTDSWTLEGNYDFGGASNILVWYNDADAEGATVGGVDIGLDGDAFGINYEYDLGGGATFVAGYVKSDYNDNDQDQFQAGVYFSF